MKKSEIKLGPSGALFICNYVNSMIQLLMIMIRSMG